MNNWGELLLWVIDSIWIGGSVLLPIIAVLIRKMQKPMQIKGEFYVMRQPGWHYLVGMGGIAFGGIASILSAVFFDRFSALLIIAVMGAFILAGVYLMIDTWMNWTLVCEDSIITHRPFCSMKRIKQYEISGVERDAGGIKGYSNGKKVFSVEDEVNDLDFLHDQFRAAGKMMDNGKREDFSVKNGMGDVVRYMIGVLLGGGILIACIFYLDDNMKYFYIIAFACFTALMLEGLISTLQWRITVSYNAISVRKAWHGEKRYLLKDITMVKRDRSFIEIFVGEKAIAKILTEEENCNLLIERLKDAKVPFFK